MNKDSRPNQCVKRSGRDHQRRGGMIILMTALILLIGIVAGMAVDVAWMQLIRTELRAATDATARIAAESLARTENHTTAQSEAAKFAQSMRVGVQPFNLSKGDFEFGPSAEQANGTWVFTPGATPYTAVRVNPKFDGSQNLNPLNLFFGNLLGAADFRPDETATASHMYQDICLVIDRSGSMNRGTSGDEYPDGYDRNDPPHPTLSRWAYLEDAIENFIDIVRVQAAEPHVSLVTWASSGYSVSASVIEVTLGTDYDGVITQLQARGDAQMRGRTNMAGGMTDGISVLTGNNVRPLARKVMILMSDGDWNEGADPETVAATAAANNIVIYTISFLDGLDQTTMINVANATGGAHYYATNEVELVEAFEKIARSLPIVLTD